MPSSKPKIVIYSDNETISKLDIISSLLNRSRANLCETILKDYISNYETKNGNIIIGEIRQTGNNNSISFQDMRFSLFRVPFRTPPSPLAHLPRGVKGVKSVQRKGSAKPMGIKAYAHGFHPKRRDGRDLNLRLPRQPKYRAVIYVTACLSP